MDRLGAPLATWANRAPSIVVGFGVLSGPRVWWQQLIGVLLGRARKHTGYAVNALEAINLLATKDPVASAWWREHCPYLLSGSRFFIFPADVCEECPDLAAPQARGLTSA